MTLRLPLYILLFLILFCCNSKTQESTLITQSELDPAMGAAYVLIHEHVLVDFGGADITGYHRWDRDAVINIVMPYLEEAKDRGVSTILECTPAYLGRDPVLLRRLADLTGINFVTNTGYYGAVNGKYLPAHAFVESAEELASRWIGEFENGIEGTGVYPGFIKIGVNEGAELSEMDAKLVHAAALTHKETDLVIVSHTGTWATAKAQIEILQEHGIDLSKFVWVHAQAEKDFSKYIEAAELGVWISLDGIAWDVDGHLARIRFCIENKLLDHVLLSHDAGWYSPGEKNGGEYVGYTALFDELIPSLKDGGMENATVDALLIHNPRKAFPRIFANE
jgi:phosphotriesterase-related protein